LLCPHTPTRLTTSPHRPRKIRYFTDLGFTHAKIRIGGTSLAQDLGRNAAAATHLAGSENLAVDAMNTYNHETALIAAEAPARFRLWWFEDICDPLDLATHARIATHYDPPIAADEAMFSAADAALLDRYAGLRRDRDILLFDPVHCYGLPGYLKIIDTLTAADRAHIRYLVASREKSEESEWPGAQPDERTRRSVSNRRNGRAEPDSASRGLRPVATAERPAQDVHRSTRLSLGTTGRSSCGASRGAD
jgi:hypothetical protein